MSIPSWEDLITTCFQSTEFMALATNGDDGLWVNPVYFAWDEEFNLYFISQLDCVHMRNIGSNELVCCAIYPTNKPAGDDVFGAYIKGSAKILDDGEEKLKADNVYYGRVYPDDKDSKKRNADGYRIDPNWHFVKIKINETSYFDTRYFDERRVPVPLNFWK